MNSTAAVLDGVVSDLAGMLRADAVGTLSDAEKLTVLLGAGKALRLLEAVVVETVASADVDFANGFGCRNLNELLQRALLTDSPGAAKVVKAADAVHREVSVTSGERLPARYPALREALLDGAVGVAGLLAATGPLERAGNRIGNADRLAADEMLAGFARGQHLPAADSDNHDSDGTDGDDLDAAGAETAGPPATPDDLRLFASEVAAVLDPDGAEPNDRNAQNGRYLSIGRPRNGLHPIRGNLLPDTAAQLQLIIDAQNNPKVGGPPHPGVAFHEEPDDEEGEGEGDGDGEDRFNTDHRNVIDPRTPGQKRHDALAAALGIAARHQDMPSLAGAAPTLVVHVDAKDFAAGTGWASVGGDATPIPVSVAAHTACTGTIQRVLFDEGRIVGITTTDRVFTIHQRRAIIARDKECLIPGCHVPAEWCEIHHVIEHARGGPT
ncbi:HNH endonuclease signature motif containing protein, partial [Microbacterium sp. SD291]|uniref:HNH endonuclease signature motif containing protein n=1 Tax=Microbacterium sp. SD291 TaxID=2782007 RepID=UPI001A96FB7B